MRPYLIRPKIKDDESLFSHLIRAAKCNMVSADRMSHSIGLMHAYQLKPIHHQALHYDQIINTYAARFKISTADIAPKLARQNIYKNTQSIEWRSLRLQMSDLLTAPRHCPLCNKEQPDLIRDQWFIKSYEVCGYHLCDMQYRYSQNIQPCLPFDTDELINLVKNIDLHFSGRALTTQTLQTVQSVLQQISQRTLLEPENGFSQSSSIRAWPPKQLCLLGKPCR